MKKIAKKKAHKESGKQMEGHPNESGEKYTMPKAKKKAKKKK